MKIGYENLSDALDEALFELAERCEEEYEPLEALAYLSRVEKNIYEREVQIGKVLHDLGYHELSNRRLYAAAVCALQLEEKGESVDGGLKAMQDDLLEINHKAIFARHVLGTAPSTAGAENSTSVDADEIDIPGIADDCDDYDDCDDDDGFFEVDDNADYDDEDYDDENYDDYVDDGLREKYYVLGRGGKTALAADAESCAADSLSAAKTPASAPTSMPPRRITAPSLRDFFVVHRGSTDFIRKNRAAYRLMERGEELKALEIFRELHEADKTDVDTLNLMATCCLIAQEHEECRRYVAMALALEPHNIHTLLNLLVLSVSNGDKQTFKETLEILDGFGDDCSSHEKVKLAGTFSYLLDHERALRWYESYVADGLFDRHILFCCAVAAFNCGQTDLARRYFLDVRHICAEPVTAQFYLDYIADEANAGTELEYTEYLPKAEISRRFKLLLLEHLDGADGSGAFKRRAEAEITKNFSSIVWLFDFPLATNEFLLSVAAFIAQFTEGKISDFFDSLLLRDYSDAQFYDSLCVLQDKKYTGSGKTVYRAQAGKVVKKIYI